MILSVVHQALELLVKEIYDLDDGISARFINTISEQLRSHVNHSTQVFFRSYQKNVTMSLKVFNCTVASWNSYDLELITQGVH